MKRLFVIFACAALLVACGNNKAQENKCGECKSECKKEQCDKKCEKPCDKQQCEKPCDKQQCEKPCEKQQCEKPCEKQQCEKPCEKQQCEKQAAAPIQLNTEDFAKLVADLSKEWKYLGDKPAVIDFYADWCGPCKAIAPTLEEVAKEYAGQLYIYKINVDNDPAIADAFNIQVIPTLLFIPMEGRYSVKTGAMNKEELVQVITEKCFK